MNDNRGLSWGNERTAEFEAARTHFFQNNRKPSDGEVLHSTNNHPISYDVNGKKNEFKHKFFYFQGVIYAKATTPLGAGSFGSVTYAENINGKRFAVKEMKPQTNVVSDFKKEQTTLETLGELRAASDLQKKINSNSHYTLIMDYKGTSLTSYLKNNTLTDDQRIELAIKVADALYKFHRDKKYAHLDLKPDNLTYDEKTGTVGIIDFGLSMPLNKTPQNVCGTPIYMVSRDPSKFHRTHNASHDSFALIRTLYFPKDIEEKWNLEGQTTSVLSENIINNHEKLRDLFKSSGNHEIDHLNKQLFYPSPLRIKVALIIARCHLDVDTSIFNKNDLNKISNAYDNLNGDTKKLDEVKKLINTLHTNKLNLAVEVKTVIQTCEIHNVYTKNAIEKYQELFLQIYKKFKSKNIASNENINLIAKNLETIQGLELNSESIAAIFEIFTEQTESIISKLLTEENTDSLKKLDTLVDNNQRYCLNLLTTKYKINFKDAFEALTNDNGKPNFELIKDALENENNLSNSIDALRIIARFSNDSDLIEKITRLANDNQVKIALLNNKNASNTNQLALRAANESSNPELLEAALFCTNANNDVFNALINNSSTGEISNPLAKSIIKAIKGQELTEDDLNSLSELNDISHQAIIKNLLGLKNKNLLMHIWPCIEIEEQVKIISESVDEDLLCEIASITKHDRILTEISRKENLSPKTALALLENNNATYFIINNVSQKYHAHSAEVLKRILKIIRYQPDKNYGNHLKKLIHTNINNNPSLTKEILIELAKIIDAKTHLDFIKNHKIFSENKSKNEHGNDVIKDINDAFSKNPNFNNPHEQIGSSLMSNEDKITIAKNATDINALNKIAQDTNNVDVFDAILTNKFCDSATLAILAKQSHNSSENKNELFDKIIKHPNCNDTSILKNILRGSQHARVQLGKQADESLRLTINTNHTEIQNLAAVKLFILETLDSLKDEKLKNINVKNDFYKSHSIADCFNKLENLIKKHQGIIAWRDSIDIKTLKSCRDAISEEFRDLVINQSHKPGDLQKNNDLKSAQQQKTSHKPVQQQQKPVHQQQNPVRQNVVLKNTKQEHEPNSAQHNTAQSQKPTAQQKVRAKHGPAISKTTANKANLLIKQYENQKSDWATPTGDAAKAEILHPAAEKIIKLINEVNSKSLLEIDEKIFQPQNIHQPWLNPLAKLNDVVKQEIHSRIEREKTQAIHERDEALIKITSFNDREAQYPLHELLCKLKIQALNYLDRINRGNEYKGFFSTGESATNKLAQAKIMIQMIEHSLYKDKPKPKEELNTTVINKGINSELGKLYAEMNTAIANYNKHRNQQNISTDEVIPAT